MPFYQYVANDRAGNVLKICCEADTERILQAKLKEFGYTVKSIRPKAKRLFGGERNRAKLQDIVSLCRRFSVMYSAGINVMECLRLLAKESESKELTEILGKVHDSVKQGKSMSDSFATYPKVFPNFFVNMIRAGEKSGKFEYVLSKLEQYMEKQRQLRQQIRQALAYPIMVLVMIFLVITALMILVVPVFAKVYGDMGVELPWVTLALISLSQNAIAILTTLSVILVACFIFYRKAARYSTFSLYFDRIRLSLPLVGKVYHKIVLLRFVRTFGLMIKAGIPLSDSIAVAQSVANNAVSTQAAQMIQHSIQSGGTVTQAVNLYGFFPQSVAYAISAGEQAGKLGEMLNKISITIEQDVDDEVKRMIGKIEPMLTVILTVVIGFILMAIYLPMFDMIKVVRA